MPKEEECPPFYLRVDKDLREKVIQAALAQRRSVNSFLIEVLLEHLKEPQEVDKQ